MAESYQKLKMLRLKANLDMSILFRGLVLEFKSVVVAEKMTGCAMFELVINNNLGSCRTL
jgi:hypothetical protein